ncbi:MAG: GGDEF domain-containing protein [Pararheinheimera sp.]|nr:GGDEF domain-containing protein [Rheinheimera sp.]
MLSFSSLLFVHLWLRGFITLKSIVLVNLLLVLAFSKAYGAEPYTLAQIQAERIQLADLDLGDLDTRIKEINRRIAITENDSPRQAALYLIKARNLMFAGLTGIEENLAKALPLINEQQQPELFLFAMTIKSYGLYMYQNQAAEAVELLEQVQQHPAFKNDVYVQVDSLSNLLDAYYELKLYDKISKPLFKLFKILSATDLDPAFTDHHFNALDTELAYHSGLIGDVEQAITLYKKVISRAEIKNSTRNVAIAYCNMANLYFLPLSEKLQYAKASLAAQKNSPCSDVMEKIVLLEDIRQGNLNNVSRLAEFSSYQQMPGLNERSAYYAGLAYLHLNDFTSVQKMLDRMMDPNNWEQYDLLQQLYEKQGDYQKALAASKQYHQLREEKDADARKLMLASYQTRLELAQEDTKAAEQARQAERMAAAEQKAQARLYLMLVLISTAGLVTLVLTLYLYRSRQLQQQLQRLSDTDPLTGLLNRRAFLRQAEQLKLLAERQQFSLSLALVDLDFFKQINDHHGHQAGDAALRAFADAAKVTLRQTDVIGRFGGEEFILVSTQQDTETFAALLQRLQQCFAQMCLQHSKLGFDVSFSAGIASITRSNEIDNKTIEDAIRLADEQLYRAKANGRNQVCSDQLSMQFITT